MVPSPPRTGEREQSLLLRHLITRLRKELQPLRNLLHPLRRRRFPVLILHQKRELPILLMKRFQHSLGITSSSTPWNVDGALVAELVQVLEVRLDDPAFELLERLDRLHAAALPVADVSAGADALGPA